MNVSLGLSEERKKRHDLNAKSVSKGLVAGLLLLVACIGSLASALPVVIVNDFQKVEVTDRSISYRVIMWKPKGCDYVPDSQVGWYRVHNGVWEETAFEYVNDLTPNSTKPTSWISPESYGVWRWHVPDASIVEEVRTTVLHSCNGSIRTTTIGPKKL